MKHSITFMLASIVVVSACNTTKKAARQEGVEELPEGREEIAMADNSRNSLDWIGVYIGLLPCADCEGIRTEIRLKEDSSYEKAILYEGKSNKIFRESGHFKWNGTGNKVILVKSESPEDTGEGQYMVGENILVALDLEGNRIESGTLPPETFVLNKIRPDSVITGKYWRLAELNGKKLVFDENQRSEPHFILNAENSRVNGNGGCNSFNGTYELLPGNRIRLSKMASTMMACINVTYEKEYLKVLEMADNYTLLGDTLSLNRAKMAPLARFTAVYLMTLP
jgi:copper homeostasis protein (lipoprotein)